MGENTKRLFQFPDSWLLAFARQKGKNEPESRDEVDNLEGGKGEALDTQRQGRMNVNKNNRLRLKRESGSGGEGSSG